MDDKELLELAAKAAGIGPVLSSTAHNGLVIGPLARLRVWGPLTDDGDALRLAVKLHMLVDSASSGFTQVVHAGPDTEEPHNGDAFAATRRAIVRAAAEIGSKN